MDKYIKNMLKGKKLIGSGWGRDVYDLGNGNVLKVAKSIYGIRSNNREVLIYSTSKPVLKKHLAVIVDHGNGWLMMKKYDRNFPKTEEYILKLNLIYRRFKENGIMPYELFSSRTSKPNWNNIRLDRKGEIIVIDYGNFKYLRKK